MTKRKHHVVCPDCGRLARESETRFGMRHDCCDLWSWGGKPLADGRTHAARDYAHACFDPLWQSGRISRSEAYRALAWAMGKAECHMSDMNIDEASEVPNAVIKITAELRTQREQNPVTHSPKK